jgi:Luciferase-like monooxygenase
MLEIGLFHNGASSLPVITTKEGVTFNDGALPEVHRAAQETLVNQVRQGILAEKLGFQSFWLTEHHFQPEGAEMSPNPLMVQMAVAANTRRPAWAGRQHHRLAPSSPARRADRDPRRDQRRPGRMRRRPWLSAPRERDARPPVRLDDPGSGAQPQSVRRIDRDHEEVLDRAVVLASRRVLLGAADLHEVEPQADRSTHARVSGFSQGRCGEARATVATQRLSRCYRRP